LKGLVSIVLPAYNEERRLADSVERIYAELLDLERPFEIIIAENGSTDGTLRISEGLNKKYENVSYLHAERGRGNALKSAFSSANGEIILYMDVDISTDLENLGGLIAHIEEGNDFAIGSRLLPRSVVKNRGPVREFLSRAYNALVRLVLKSSLHDHQCGFKGFRKGPLLDVIKEVRDSQWFFDTEFLVRAQRKGYSVFEMPVLWEDRGMTKVKVTRDIFVMGKDIFLLWWDLGRRKG